MTRTPLTPRQIGRHWLFADGTLRPVVGGGDGVEGAPIEIPESFDGLDYDALVQLEDDLAAEFDRLNDADGDLAEMTRVAEGFKAVRAEKKARDDRAAEDAAERERLAEEVHGAKPKDEPNPDDDPDDDPSHVSTGDEDDDLGVVTHAPDGSKEGELVAAAEKVARTPARPRGASAGNVHRNTPSRPTARQSGDRAVLTAAADLAGHSTGTLMTLTEVAEAFHDKAAGLEDHSARIPVTRIKVPIPEDRWIRTTDPMAAKAALDKATKVESAQSLVASGGFCAPSPVVWELFALESTEGLLDLPDLGITRAGIQVPSFLGLSDAAGALWTWTEANDIAAGANFQITNKALTTNVATLTTQAPHNLAIGDVVIVQGVDSVFNGTYIVTTVPSTTTFTYAKTNANVASAAVSPVGYVRNNTPSPTKPCLTIPCPTFTEYRLEAEGLCITHGNLQDRAWPEVTSRFVALATAGHLHRMSAASLTKIMADITTASNTITVTSTGSDTFGEVISALQLQRQDMISQYKMAENSVFEAVMPMWLKDACRVSLAMRAGVDLLKVTNAQINAAFVAEGFRPQFVHALDAMWSGTLQAAWPTSCTIVLMIAGSYFRMRGGTIDLGVQRDSAQNATNDFTVAWSEEFYQVGRRGPSGRTLTVTLDTTGNTACCP